MSSWTEAFRFLKEETDDHFDEIYGVHITTVGRPDDDTFESEWDDDDTYLVEPWGWTLVTVAGAFIIAACIFVATYKYHLCSAKDSTAEENNVGDVDLENGKKIATKVFVGSSPPPAEQSPPRNGSVSTNTDHSDSPGMSLGADNQNHNHNHNHLHNLATAPRCVLCSKAYEVGENVTQSSACHHEYHEQCLVKHWKKQSNNDNNGKCPVCKVEYVVEEVAPSKQFSPSSRRMSHSERVPEPFDT